MIREHDYISDDLRWLREENEGLRRAVMERDALIEELRMELQQTKPQYIEYRISGQRVRVRSA